MNFVKKGNNVGNAKTMSLPINDKILSTFIVSVFMFHMK